MPVAQYLDLSTAHITQTEMETLDGPPNEWLPRVIGHKYGAWIHVPALEDDECEHLRRHKYPNVQALIDRARELDCAWINLDRDADREGGLPTFDW